MRSCPGRGKPRPVPEKAPRGLFRAAALALAALWALAPAAWGGQAPRVIGGIVPHHDLAVEMIENFYRRAGAAEAKRVWLLSPDHFRRARTFAPFSPDDWRTPSRVLKADREAAAVLGVLSVSGADGALFQKEHGITIHIPYVAEFFPNASVVPVVVRSQTPDLALLELKKAILRIAGSNDVFILSMDLSHYKTPEAMAKEDEKTLSVLTKLNHARTGEIDVDARRAAALLLMILRELGAAEGEILARSDSSEILGRRVGSGTSYAAVIYGRGPAGSGPEKTRR